jgi:hypothetical protein
MDEKLLKERGRLWDTKRDDIVFLCALCVAAVFGNGPEQLPAVRWYAVAFSDTTKCMRTRSTRLATTFVLITAETRWAQRKWSVFVSATS